MNEVYRLAPLTFHLAGLVDRVRRGSYTGGRAEDIER
jgi:hypothetical protein